MGKQIAVILCSINLDNQKKILQGLIAAARETDTNLYVFTNYVGMRESAESVLSAYRIMELPDFRKFDGLIMAINTVYLSSTAEYIMEKIRETGIPTVSIDREFEGMSCVRISSYDAESELIEHMITKHGHRDIHYVTGPDTNRESQLRFQAYQDVLKKHDIPFREEMVYHGGFTLQTGMDAANHFLKVGSCPRCIVCGNDAMALGVMEVLQDKGYEVPNDVCIAGFDNGELSELNFPPLTTVDKGQFEIGQKAVYEILERVDGKAPETCIVPCKLENRGSCGCSRKKHIDVRLLRKKYIEQQKINDRMADTVRNMMADLSGKNNIQSILQVVKKYVLHAEMGDFYLCLCEKEKVFRIPEKNIGKSLDIAQKNTDFTEKIYIPLAYEDKEFHSYPYFDKGFVLPEECRQRASGNVYIVTPCFFQNSCFGYSVCANAETVVENGQYYSWMTNIAVALENARNRMQLEDAVVTLNSMWSYDMLTKLHNRAGFYNEARPMLDNMKQLDQNAFILFFDVDGLKKINDTKGHETGDLLIKAMADCIRCNLEDGMLAMRYGGDEFVVFGRYEDPLEIEELMDNIRASVNTINNSGKYEFTLSTSIGSSAYRATEIAELSSLIDMADQNMYEEKRRKR